MNWSSLYGNPNSSLHAQAKGEIAKGNLVIACMGPGLWTSSGHFVLVWEIQGNTVYLNDPASTKAARTRGDYTLFRRQVKYSFLSSNARPSCRRHRRRMKRWTSKH